MIDINTLFCTQRSLKRFEQIPEFIDIINNDGFLDTGELIELHLDTQNRLVINNGHHRAAAIFLSKRQYLDIREYRIICKATTRPITMPIKDLVNMYTASLK